MDVIRIPEDLVRVFKTVFPDTIRSYDLIESKRVYEYYRVKVFLFTTPFSKLQTSVNLVKRLLSDNNMKYVKCTLHPYSATTLLLEFLVGVRKTGHA